MPNKVNVDGNELKRFRKESNVVMSRRELAERTGVPEYHIAQLESGRSPRAFPVVVEALARALLVEPTDIAPDYQPPIPRQLGRVHYDRQVIHQLLALSGMTQKEWADASGFSVSTAHSLLNREIPSADVELIYKAAKGLGIKAGDLSQPLSQPPAYGDREYLESAGTPLEDV